ncbi:MAG: M1 family metallopeptidase [Candidatus Zixiibacteriota bacterium]
MNTSSKAVDTLLFHLYPNAFRSDTTTFMKESYFPDRIKRDGRYRGSMEIERISLNSGLDLTDRKIVDETVMKLPLPVAFPPQDSLSLDIDFTVKLPEILARMGYSGDDFMIGQWFPKMAVLEEDGTWNAHPYHFNSEFFADFGTYDVSITLPRKYVVGATGHLASARDNADSSRTWSFHAEDVHDFAWAASPDYLISKKEIDGIEVNFFYHPEHRKDVEKIMEYAEFGLRYFSSSFGAYPYDHFTIVDTKIGLAGGAMEYPTLITISPSGLPPEEIRADALVIFHEEAHQWWYGMVASNEFEEAWLDEGFAFFSESRAMEKRFGKTGNAVDLWGIKLSDLNFAKLGYLLDPQSDPVVKKSWEFEDYLSYRTNVYFKASLVLKTLGNILGEEKMDEVMKEYFRKYRFRHPKTSDFVQVVNEIGGQDLTSVLKQLLYGTGLCDYEVASIKSTPYKSDNGKIKFKDEVVVKRLGDVVIPVDVVAEFENGQKMKEVWDGQERWHKIEMETDSEMRSAVIDSEDKLVLDINVDNNSMATRSCDSVMMKLSAECLFYLESLMHWITCL